jgi:hypothetical protein
MLTEQTLVHWEKSHKRLEKMLVARCAPVHWMTEAGELTGAIPDLVNEVRRLRQIIEIAALAPEDTGHQRVPASSGRLLSHTNCWRHVMPTDLAVGDWVAERTSRYGYGPRVGQIERVTPHARLTVLWQGRWWNDEPLPARWAAGGLASTVKGSSVRRLTLEEVAAMEGVPHAD